MTRGKRGLAEVDVLFTPLHDIDGYGRFVHAYGQFRGMFDDHIAKSIPGYFEVQVIKGHALQNMFGLKGGAVLDVGSSESSFIKTLSHISHGRISTLGLEPNPDMCISAMRGIKVRGFKIECAAYGLSESVGQTAWRLNASKFLPIELANFGLSIQDGGVNIPFFDPKGRLFDIVHESETFQFMGSFRASQLARAKELCKVGGILIVEEKFLCDADEFLKNEFEKDTNFKINYFSASEILSKRAEILDGGMTRGLVDYREMEGILRTLFPYVARYWKAGNFRGYAASNNRRNLDHFLGIFPTERLGLSDIEVIRVASV